MVFSYFVGLYNDMLESQSAFDDDSLNIISSFLNRLPKPVCLVAHYGYGFDFKVLSSEIRHLQKDLCIPNLYCVDSIEVFRGLDFSLSNEQSYSNGSTVPKSLNQTTTITRSATAIATPYRNSNGEEAQSSNGVNFGEVRVDNNNPPIPPSFHQVQTTPTGQSILLVEENIKKRAQCAKKAESKCFDSNQNKLPLLTEGGPPKARKRLFSESAVTFQSTQVCLCQDSTCSECGLVPKESRLQEETLAEPLGTPIKRPVQSVAPQPTGMITPPSYRSRTDSPSSDRLTPSSRLSYLSKTSPVQTLPSRSTQQIILALSATPPAKGTPPASRNNTPKNSANGCSTNTPPNADTGNRLNSGTTAVNISFNQDQTCQNSVSDQVTSSSNISTATTPSSEAIDSAVTATEQVVCRSLDSHTSMESTANKTPVKNTMAAVQTSSAISTPVKPKHDPYDANNFVTPVKWRTPTTHVNSDINSHSSASVTNSSSSPICHTPKAGPSSEPSQQNNTPKNRSAMKYVPNQSYKLEAIYQRTFGKLPEQSHFAEDDCISLMKVAKARCPEFIEWIDKHAKEFKLSDFRC